MHLERHIFLSGKYLKILWILQIFRPFLSKDYVLKLQDFLLTNSFQHTRKYINISLPLLIQNVPLRGFSRYNTTWQIARISMRYQATKCGHSSWNKLYISTGQFMPRKSKVDDKDLPSARLISTSLTKNPTNVDHIHSMLVMQMGQFIDHDITFTPNHQKQCCMPHGRFPGRFGYAQ